MRVPGPINMNRITSLCTSLQFRQISRPATFPPLVLCARDAINREHTRGQCTKTSMSPSGPHCETTTKRKSTSQFSGERRGTGFSKIVEFWGVRQIWIRSTVNTFRCLVGCTSGDFATMWYLQSSYPELNTMTTMGLAMTAGISTSIMLETALLHWGKDSLPWILAARTATGMSMISMLAMELTENAVNYHLTGGQVDYESLHFWIAAVLATAAGFLVPLPYNYFRLRAYKKACH